MNLTGKTVLLTGAASGLGRELALQLEHLGCNLLLADRDQLGLTSLVGELTCEHETFLCDLGELQERKALVRAANERAVDILINNAGIGSHSRLSQLGVDEVERVLQVNALAPLELAAGLSPLDLIVNIGSVAGEMDLPSMGLYAASKASLHAFTRAIRLEGVRTLLVILGPMRGTNFLHSIAHPHTGQPAWYRNLDFDAKIAASKIIHAIQKDKQLVILPGWYRIVIALARLLYPILKLSGTLLRE